MQKNAGSLKKTPGRVAKTLMTLIIIVTSFVIAGGQKRKATQKQIELYKEVKTVFSSSIPSCPEGWSGDANNELPEPGEDFPNADFPSHFYHQVVWNDNVRKQAADEEIQKALCEKAQKDMSNSSLQAEEQKLSKDIENLVKQEIEAVEKKDYVTAERLKEEMHSLGEKNKALQQVRDNGTNSIMEKLSAHDVKVIISFRINEFNNEPGGGSHSYTQEASIAGFPTFRTKGEWTERWGWTEESTDVMLGGKGWHINTQAGRCETTEQKGVPSTTIQTIIVRVQADPVRAKQILKKIDWNALKSLMKH